MGGYVSESKFNRVEQIRDIKDLASAQRVINKLIGVINDTHAKLNGELRNIERGVSGNADVTIVNVSGVGGTSGSSSANIRAGKSTSVPASATVISFSTALSVSYVLLLSLKDSTGAGVGYDAITTTSTGFTITPMAVCDVEYCAIGYN